MSFTRDTLFQFKPRIKEIKFPDHGNSLFIRELKASDVVSFSNDQKSNPTQAVYNLIIAGTTNEDGTPFFTTGDGDAIAALPYQISDKLVDAILTFSGLKADESKKKPAETK